MNILREHLHTDSAAAVWNTSTAQATGADPLEREAALSRICAARREARPQARRATSWRKRGVNRLTPWTWGAFAHVKRENKNMERASVFS